MIIKPIESESEFKSYANSRYVANNHYAGFIDNNIALDQNQYELDSYDLEAFHLGAYSGKELYACTRMVNDTRGTRKFSLNPDFKQLIQAHLQPAEPKNSLSFQDFVEGHQLNLIEAILSSKRRQGYCFNEIGRLIRCNKRGEKHLMKYMICYCWAFDRYHEIDYCYFEAPRSHNLYYQRFFNCKPILEEIEFRPLLGEETCFLMQATTENLPPPMNVIVNRIVDKFKGAGGPCAVEIDELK